MYSLGEEAPFLKAAMNGLDISSHPSCGLIESVPAIYQDIRLPGVSHVVDPFGGAIVGMGRFERANVVGLAVIVPSDDLNEPRAKREDLIPSMVPK